MTKAKVKGVLIDSNMLERSDSVSAPMQSAVKLRWKIATRKLREKQFMTDHCNRSCNFCAAGIIHDRESLSHMTLANVISFICS